MLHNDANKLIMKMASEITDGYSKVIRCSWLMHPSVNNKSCYSAGHGLIRYIHIWQINSVWDFVAEHCFARLDVLTRVCSLSSSWWIGATIDRYVFNCIFSGALSHVPLNVFILNVWTLMTSYRIGHIVFLLSKWKDISILWSHLKLSE